MHRQTKRGHHVITSGSYCYERHPGYAAIPFPFVGGGMALGSLLSTLISLLMVVSILRRTAEEDRILCERLEGYAAYAQKGRYRVFPRVWYGRPTEE